MSFLKDKTILSLFLILVISTTSYIYKREITRFFAPKRFLLLSHIYIKNKKLNVLIFSNLKTETKINSLEFKDKKGRTLLSLKVNRPIKDQKAQFNLPIDSEEILESLKSASFIIDTKESFFQKNEIFHLKKPKKEFGKLLKNYSKKKSDFQPNKLLLGSKLKLSLDINQLLKLEHDINNLGGRKYRFEDELVNYKAQIQNDEKTYNVTVDIHGDLDSHWRREKKSFRVQLKKGSKIAGLSQFSLIRAEDKYFDYEVLSQQISKTLDLFYRNVQLVDLEVNKKNYGKYLFYEKNQPEAIITNQYKFSHIVSQNNAWKVSLDSNQFLNSPFMKRSQSDNENSLYPPLYKVRPKKANAYVMNEFTKALQETTDKSVDIEDFSKYLSIVAMTGSYHSVLIDNLRWAYKIENKKFSPIFYDSIPRKLREKPEDFLNEIKRLNYLCRKIIELKDLQFWSSQIKKYSKEVSNKIPHLTNKEILKHNIEVVKNWN